MAPMVNTFFSCSLFLQLTATANIGFENSCGLNFLALFLLQCRQKIQRFLALYHYNSSKKRNFARIFKHKLVITQLHRPEC